MRRLEPITIKLAKVNREDNFVTSTRQWIKEVREDIKNGFNKKGFNKNGFNKEGYDLDGYDKKGYWNRELDFNRFRT